MNDLAAAALLGIVQGLTEFLPVSSTAHLILVSDLLKLDPERFGLSFDVALHLGTALAVLLYFARTWIDLVVGLFRGRWRMPALIVLGTAPAAIAGVLFESAVSRELRGPLIIAAGLVRELRREDATRLAFLLATPVILGAGAKTLLDARKAAELFAQPDVLAVGFVLSFLSGLAAVAFMVRFLRAHSLNWFVAYRLVLAAAIVAAVAAGML